MAHMLQTACRFCSASTVAAQYQPNQRVTIYVVAGVTLAAYAVPVSLAYAGLPRACAAAAIWAYCYLPRARLRALRIVAPSGPLARPSSISHWLPWVGTPGGLAGGDPRGRLLWRSLTASDRGWHFAGWPG